MRFAFIFLLAFLSFGAAMAAEGAASYYVPPGQLNASVQVMNLGLSNIIGLFGNATGSFSFDEQAKTISNLRVAVDAGSLISSNSQSQSDLANLLAISQYPEIRFTALDNVVFADGKASIKGTLTVHGASKSITFDAVLNHAGKSAQKGTWSGEGDVVGLSLHGSFKRAEFGMGDDPEVPGRFGDTISLQLEMQATRQ